jgi:hypothetical protein
MARTVFVETVVAVCSGFGFCTLCAEDVECASKNPAMGHCAQTDTHCEGGLVCDEAAGTCGAAPPP